MVDVIDGHVLKALPAVELWALDRLCVYLDLVVHPDWLNLLVERGWGYVVVETYPGRDDAHGNPLTIKRYRPDFRAATAYRLWCERVVAQGEDDSITEDAKAQAALPRPATVN